MTFKAIFLHLGGGLFDRDHVLLSTADMQDATCAMIVFKIKLVAKRTQTIAAIDRNAKRLFQIDPGPCIGAVAQEPKAP